MTLIFRLKDNMYRYNDKKINGHYIYLDNSRNPILLPCLFARFTQVSGLRIEVKTKVEARLKQKVESFSEKEIGADMAYKITNHLGRFLEWVENYDEGDFVNLMTHTALPNEILNTYVNEYLIDECQSSEFVAHQAVNSLTAYYDWLFFFFKISRRKIGVKSAYRSVARNNNHSNLVVKYLLPNTRQLFYRSTESLLEEVVLRNGGELGCRTKENQGFLLSDYKANKETYSGLLTLFSQYEANNEQSEFEYVIPSIYTKYGRARVLYISRELLGKMKKYYETERPQTNSNHLLVSSSSNSSFGNCISESFGSDTFRKAREKIISKVEQGLSSYSTLQEITISNKYHHLRHSFGTDIFYNLCEGNNKDYETITTTSSVFLETARRLGHKVDSKHAGAVTKGYIHSCGMRERLLREVAKYG